MKKPQGRHPNRDTLNQMGEALTPREDSKPKRGNSSTMRTSAPRGRTLPWRGTQTQ